MNRIQQQAGQEATHRASDADPASLATPAAEARLEVGEASQAVVDSTVVPTQVPDSKLLVGFAFRICMRGGVQERMGMGDLALKLWCRLDYHLEWHGIQLQM